ncbi:unnamed protein product [Spirodela intermedia]|uniref:Uncharacterized protein n=1 Tax=Spirodela intermedia TaxID=51605 RepID=A0A7I8LB76_SPIIN|nr:unnamed protein product [Spirodela intermedia]
MGPTIDMTTTLGGDSEWKTSQGGPAQVGVGQGNHNRGQNETPLQIEGPKWIGCHICGGPHRSVDCLDRDDRRMSSLEIEEVPHLNIIQLLNVVQVKAIQEALRKLLFIEAIINSTPTKVLIDSGDTHNFLSKKEAHNLGLSLVHTNNKIKAINSEAQTSIKLAQHVKTQMGTCEDQLDFLVLRIDDFDVILRANFTTIVKVRIFLHYNDILICGGEFSYFVQRTAQEGARPQTISIMQLKNEMWHEADMFLVTLQEVEGEGQKVRHPHVLSLLNEFQDIMLDKLPTKLPPR